MEVVTLLRAAQTAGLKITIERDGLVVEGPPSAEGVVQQLKEHKAAFLVHFHQSDSRSLHSTLDSPSLRARVFETARRWGFPRVTLPGGRICHGEWRWGSFTSTSKTPDAELIFVLLHLNTLGDPRDLPEQEAKNFPQVTPHDRALLVGEAERADFRSVEFRPGARAGGSRDRWELFAARNSFAEIELARAAIRLSLS